MHQKLKKLNNLTLVHSVASETCVKIYSIRSDFLKTVITLIKNWEQYIYYTSVHSVSGEFIQNNVSFWHFIKLKKLFLTSMVVELILFDKLFAEQKHINTPSAHVVI